jgi:SAM-dependent MidA family methyltransferase
VLLTHCFENKEINFSISWFPSVQTYYTEYMQKRIKVMKGLKEGSDESLEEEAKDMMNHPCFILAHELFDALPVH